MAKIHWSGGSVDLRIGCERECGNRFGSIQHRSWPASVFVERATASPDHHCAHCAKAARIALAAESAPNPTSRCSVPGCGSHAINPGHHGRTEGADLDLCDVCYWRKRAESATWPKPRPISEAPTDGTSVLAHWSVGNFPRLRGCRWEVARVGSGLAWFNEHNEPLSAPDYFLPLPPEVM